MIDIRASADQTYFTSKEFAKQAKRPSRLVRYWMKEGRIKSVKIDGRGKALIPATELTVVASFRRSKDEEALVERAPT